MGSQDSSISRVPVYQPSSWSHDFIESLETNFPINNIDVEKKVMDLRLVFRNDLSTLQLLELVDDIQQLGLGYRFQDDISEALKNIALINDKRVGDEQEEDNLHEVSLKFRLLRQHGYNVSQDFVKRFKDSHGVFTEGLQKDIKGLMSLYEASYLAFEGEKDLHEAKLFATAHLMTIKSEGNESLKHVNHALELPLYRRCHRLHARWYIEAYCERKDAILLLLELATLDFNVVQSAFKTELQQVSKWWKHIGLASKLSFTRDRLVECFFWTVGMVFEPQYHSFRIWLTKVGTLITVIDDIYDVYASLDQLEIFTYVVKRWDIDSAKDMPEFLQLGFQALYNTVRELGSNTSITPRGEDIVPILVKVWGELLETFLVEAKWTHDKYIPTLENYLDNAWRSASGVLILTHGYILINKDVVESLEKYHQLLKWSSMLFRLYNDLGSSSDEIKRGKTANAVSCYMHEKDVCEEVACQYIKTLIDQAWSELINHRIACSQESTDPFIDMAINLARISQWAYQYGDAVVAPDDRVKDQVLSVLIKPIPNLVLK